MRLEIDRLSLDCLVGGDHPDPHGARDRVVALSRRLPHSLGEQVRPLSGGGEIILVRSLELDLTLDLDGPESANLAHWSQAFAAQLARQLSARGQGVVRFADRAEQLACFVRDLVNGDAWSLWFHRPFAGLRALPAARALATALGADPVRGQAALARLDEGTIAKAGELLGPGIDPLAEMLCEDIPAGAVEADLIAPLCEAALRHLPAPGPRLLATLKAHAEATGRPCGKSDLTLCRAVVDALAGESFRSENPAASPGRGREPGHPDFQADASVSPGAGEVARQVRSYARTAKVRRLGTLFGGPLLLLRDLDRIDLGFSLESRAETSLPSHAESLAGNRKLPVRHAEERAKPASRSTHQRRASFETPAPRAPQDDEEGSFRSGPHEEGSQDEKRGLFPPSAEDPTDSEAAGPNGWPAASALRMLVLAWLAGPGRGRDFLADPFWRDLLDMPPQLSPSGLVRWADTGLAYLSRAIAFGARDPIPLPGGERRAGAKRRPGEGGRPLRRGRSPLSLPSPPRGEGSRASCRAECDGLAHPGEVPATERRPPWPNGLDLAPAAEHHIATLAGLVLDGFAHRLPGFSRSSAGHLFTNSLDVRASILHQEDEGLTALVSRPPLDPILALSGAASWTAEFSWTSPRRIGVSRDAR